jgi:hypothetical protein
MRKVSFCKYQEGDTKVISSLHTSIAPSCISHQKWSNPLGLVKIYCAAKKKSTCVILALEIHFPYKPLVFFLSGAQQML